MGYCCGKASRLNVGGFRYNQITKKGKLKMICCFCEKTFSAGTKICGFCNEYKGLMTIADFEKTYGKEN